MVIEIDRKKVAKLKRDALLVSTLYVVLVVLHLSTIVDELRRGSWDIGFNLFSLLLWSLALTALWQTVRRALRHRRTEHHLYIDQTGITMVNGHARVDIPWGDVENISKGGMRSDSSFFPQNIKIQLRKESPYSKRTYRLYNDYEQSLGELHTQINEMWSAEPDKLKLLTI